MSAGRIVAVAVITWLLHSTFAKHFAKKIDPRSPLYLGLPDCRDENEFSRIVKETKAMGIVCSSFKNEEGFLSEFVTYYHIHGISHVRLYDRGSVDNGLAEIKPWISNGFVSVETSISDPHHQNRIKNENAKLIIDKQCKKWAQTEGYDYYFSVDINEYILPLKKGTTIMDAMSSHVLTFNQAILDMPILKFQAAPHTLEPIDLLTVEAYQLRAGKENGRMSFNNVSSKVALAINQNSYDKLHRDYMIHCCNVHGCFLQKIRCHENGAVGLGLHGFHQPEDSTKLIQSPLVLFRYARSLEKFELQFSVFKDSTTTKVAIGQSIDSYMRQSSGTERDDRAATRYGCQMREVLQNVTGEEYYLRPGTYWYRNVAYGKELSDGRKGKRNGQLIKSGNKVGPADPHEYHGYYKRGMMNLNIK